MKTKSKKIISIILSVLMIMAIVPTSLFAIAADKANPVAALEQEIDAYKGKLNVADPTEEDLNGYNALVDSFKALTTEEKEEMNVFSFDKLYSFVLTREYQLQRKAGVSGSSAYKAAGKQIPVVLDGVPAYVDEATALYKTLNDKKVTTADKKEALGKASENARIMAGGYYASYECFYYRAESYLDKAFETVATAVYNELLKANPNPEAKPATPSAPKDKDYPLGKEDPGYKAAYEEYLAKKKEVAQWESDDCTYKGGLYIQAMTEAAEAAPEFKPVIDAAAALKEAKTAFDKNNDSSKASAAVAAYDKLESIDKLRFDKLSYALYGTVVWKYSNWNCDKLKAPALYSACVDIGNMKYIDEFAAIINSIEEPYSRDDINKAKDAYAKVPKSLQDKVPAEAMEKYAAILAAIAPDDATQTPSIEDMPKTNVNYPISAPKCLVERNLSNLEYVVLAAAGLKKADLPALVASNLYTNATVGKVAGFLYPTLASAVGSLMTITPSKLTQKLTEEKFAGAVATLNAAAEEYGDTVDAWANIEFKSGDFGFEDGDREGFLDAVVTLFRPASLITMVLTLENTISTTNGTYTYGAYEDLVPIFEALDLRGYVSSHDYTLAVNAAETDNLKMDARIRQLLVPIFNLIDDIAADPINSIMNLLPKLAYAVNTGIVNNQVNTLLARMSLFGKPLVPPVNLTTEGIYDIIAPMLQNINVSGQTVSIKLNRDKFVKLFADLSGCGTYVLRDSAARGMVKHIAIDSDKADAFMVLFYWLHGELVSADNIAAINSVVDGLIKNNIVKGIVSALVKVFSYSSPATMITAVSALLPVAKIFVVCVNVVTKLINAIKAGIPAPISR